MIRLTRINHVPLVLNSDLIEHVEVTPDTIITLTSGQKLMVLESADEVIDRVIQYRRAVLAGVHPLSPGREIDTASSSVEESGNHQDG